MVQINVARDTIPTDEYDTLAAGEYVAMIIGEEECPTKANDGSKLLKLTIQVVEGDRKGANIFHNLNLWNKNQQATEIAWKDLGKIMDALGMANVGDTVEMHNKPFRIVYGPQKKNPEYSEIKSFKPVSSAPATTTPAAAPPAPPPHTEAPAATNNMPWAK